MIATFMFAAALLLTATAATLIQRWAIGRHVAHEPPPAAEAPEPPTFRLGSPFAVKKAGTP